MYCPFAYDGVTGLWRSCNPNCAWLIPGKDAYKGECAIRAIGEAFETVNRLGTLAVEIKPVNDEESGG